MLSDEHLPPMGDPVLAYNGHIMEVVRRTLDGEGGWYWGMSCPRGIQSLVGVTHWQPLPAAPERKE